MAAHVLAEATQLTPQQFDVFWPEIQKEMDRVPHLWTPWWTKESLWEGTMNGRFQVWTAGESGRAHLVLFTQIVYYPANTVMQAILFFGNGLEKYAAALDAVLEQFARERGCTIQEVTGRPGWEPFLAPLGFKKQAVVLHRTLQPQRIQ